VIAAAGLIFVSVVVYVAAMGRSAAPTVEQAEPTLSGDVSLNAAQFDDGRTRFYRYATAEGKEVRFFVLKSSDGVIRAAFDTCDVCYRERKGYRQVGDTMVCNNCDRAFRSIDINVLQGGCNPVPLDRVVADGQVVLTAKALQAGKFYF
jgi:uncharacterized membrane protein